MCEKATPGFLISLLRQLPPPCHLLSPGLAVSGMDPETVDLAQDHVHEGEWPWQDLTQKDLQVCRAPAQSSSLRVMGGGRSWFTLMYPLAEGAP